MEVVAVNWNLDVGGAKRLEDEKLSGAEGVVLVDLAECAFVASSGLRVLLKAAQGLSDGGGGKLVVSGMNPTVAEVFEISGFSGVIDTFDDVETALAQFG